MKTRKGKGEARTQATQYINLLVKNKLSRISDMSATVSGRKAERLSNCRI